MTKDAGAGTSADLARVLSRFPGPHQAYFLFLECCDSFNLSRHLQRCMAARLTGLVELLQSPSLVAPLGDCTMAANTLAMYCSFLDCGGKAPAAAAAAGRPRLAGIVLLIWSCRLSNNDTTQVTSRKVKLEIQARACRCRMCIEFVLGVSQKKTGHTLKVIFQSILG